MDKKAVFADIKVGDEVWDVCRGWGVVCGLTQHQTYPVDVEFGEIYDSYTRDGFFTLDDINPTLYWDEIKLEAPPKPLPDLQVDAIWQQKVDICLVSLFPH